MESQKMESQKMESSSKTHEPFWKMARGGMTMLLNNQQEEASALFQSYPESIIMYSGYAAVTFMDALMSYEEDKLTLASHTLKETEKRCSGGGWFKLIRGKSHDEDASYEAYLESQIIKADAEMYLATLTFLQQDIAGYFRGAWMLRKSWKHYQQTYNEIQDVYNKVVGESLLLPEDASSQDLIENASHQSFNDDIHDPRQIPSDLRLGLANEDLKKFASTMTNTASNSVGLDRNGKDQINKETITRLMKGISFGYGLLQLGMSLLPPSILRLTNFLGFHGNRPQGLVNLAYAKTGEDMRAPLATLALLWYHTIVRPFFSLDGNNVQAGVQVAANLIDEAMEVYSNSAIFLFFKGRVDRLKSDIPSAILAFRASVEYSNHREIKILSQHEVGWCYLIQLDHESAQASFNFLKMQSRWSRGFYAYLTVISAGANKSLTEANHRECSALFMSTPKGSQLDDFLARRFRVCRMNTEQFLTKHQKFWRMLVYELLYLWNSLPSCNHDNLRVIIEDCEEVIKGHLEEPFLGLSSLIVGSTYCILKDYPNGIRSFRNCLDVRKNTSFHADDAHVSAFSLYELGQLLIKDPETKSEGKACLQHVQNYKDYDFEHRLSVRIYSILKRL